MVRKPCGKFQWNTFSYFWDMDLNVVECKYPKSSRPYYQNINGLANDCEKRKE